MDLKLDGKVAFVAGSSRGIGKSIAHSFVREGARVIVTGRKEGDVVTTVEELTQEFGPERILGLSGDLGVTEKSKVLLKEAVAAFGRLDIIVGNIGTGRGKTGFDLSDSEWDRLLYLNLLTNIRVAREGAPYLIKNGGGSIIFTASIAGLESLGAPVAYEAAKAAIISSAKSLSRDLAQYNIRVNCVAPGNILFPGSTWDLKLKENRKGTMNYIARNVPFKRFGTPEEIASIVVFLASEEASFVTGACVVADGGQTRRF
jgi:3-oxoacyl-[acyl-carrier protein] reductase